MLVICKVKINYYWRRNIICVIVVLSTHIIQMLACFFVLMLHCGFFFLMSVSENVSECVFAVYRHR